MANDNKKNEKLDFRNIKFSQFSPGQIDRMEFSELHSAKRVLNTNTIVKDGYTHFKQVLDGENRPTKVDYYQALDSTIDTVIYVADVAGNRAGEYYQITNPIDGKVYVIYQFVSGVGAAPGIGDVEIPAIYNNNDSNTLVAYANRQALSNIPDLVVKNSGFLENFASIEYNQFGLAEVVDVSSSGFSVSRTKAGESCLVASVELEYDVDGNIIWQDETLKGALYNPYRAEFSYGTKAYISDENGDPFSDDNPLPVAIVDGIADNEILNLYNEVSSIATGIETTIISYTVPASTSAFFQKAHFSGTNMATYTVEVNSVVVDKKRTYFGSDIDGTFDFSVGTKGFPLEEADVLTIKVTHNRPNVGDFNTRLQLILEI